MPALTMRGRYLMREYWSDSDLFLKLKAEEREVYIGLWMLSDDEGWMPRDVPAIAKNVRGYAETRSGGEDEIRAALDRLREIGKVVSHRCCLFLPAVSKYPRAGKKSSEHLAEHQRHSKRVKRIQTDLNPSPVPSLPYPTEPVVADARPQERRGPTRFADAMAAAGVRPELTRRTAS